MKQHTQSLRIAAVALFASAAFLHAPVFGQAAPVVAPPPPVQAAPPPPPVAVTPPPVVAPAPAPRAATPEPQARQTVRPAPRAVERSIRTASRAAPEPAPVAESAPPPVVEGLPPPPVEQAAPPPAVETSGQAPADRSLTPWLLAAGLAPAIALIGFLFWRRRRASEQDHYYDQAAYEESTVAAEPVPPIGDYQPALVTPAFRRAEPVHEPEVTAAATGIALGAADRADMEALAASSTPEGHRPWLEFLMRPVRAGTSGDDALVEFALTVGNTGTAAAEDVRISTWLLGDGASEMERSLIEAPADAATSEARIGPGDGAKIEATIAVPRERLAGDVLPVVVADARYRLPGGGEGRTSARFAVGLPSGDGLAPFAVALGDGLREDVEVRLHGEPEHV